MPECFGEWLLSLDPSDKLELYKWFTQDSRDINRVISILDTIDPLGTLEDTF